MVLLTASTADMLPTSLYTPSESGASLLVRNITDAERLSRLGYITPDDAPMIIDRIIDTSSYEIDENHPPLSPPHWRGRMGYSKAKLEESVIGFNPTPRR